MCPSDFARAPAPLTIPCQVCGRRMVERRNAKNGSTFMACVGFTERDGEDRPACTETAGVPASIVMERAGAQRLPGLG